MKKSGKVTALFSPIGEGDLPVATHTLSYGKEGFRKVTYVKDALGNLTEYKHSKKRLRSIVHHLEKGEITENFAWHP